MPVNDKWTPKATGIRLPTDAKKKNGMFWNWPRFLKFGGAPGAPAQDGTKGPDLRPANSAVGPISDRGKGR